MTPPSRQFELIHAATVESTAVPLTEATEATSPRVISIPGIVSIMGRDGTGGGYDFMEIFIIKFVLADVIIIAALLLADPIYAVAITALLVASVFVTWYLTERVGAGGATAAENAGAGSEPDPVTKLQDRYAAGELSEAEFEAALDRLIDANERAERAGVETDELSIERSK